MNCVVVHADGSTEQMVLCQSQASEYLGGAVTFVGAVDEVRCFAVGLRDSAQLPLNTACTDPKRFDVPVRGSVLFVATDDSGEETHVDAERLLACLFRSD